MSEQQRQEHEPDETMQVESEEQEQGKREIEVRKRICRRALLWSAIAAGLSMGASLAAKAFSTPACRTIPAAFHREPRLYLRFHHCHHGAPAVVYRKHRHGGIANHA